MKLSPSNWRCPAISPSSSLTKAATIWPNKIVLYGPIKMQGSGDHGQGFGSIEASSPLVLVAHFSFPSETHDCVSWLSCNTEDAVLEPSHVGQGRLAQNGADHGETEQVFTEQSRTDQRTAEQSYLAGGGQTPGLPHCHAVSQLIVFFFTAPLIGNSWWCWVGTTNHLLTKTM